MLPLILAPFLLTALAAYYFVIRSNEIEAREKDDKRISEAISDIRKDLQGARRDLVLLRGVPAVGEFLEDPGSRSKETAAGTVMKLFFDQNPYYLELSLTDSRGRELVRYSRLTNVPAVRELSAEDHFLRALVAGSSQAPVHALANGRHATVLSERIADDRLLGALVLSLNTDAFERRLTPLLPTHGFSTFLFDDRGLVFSRSLAGEPEEKALQGIELSREASALLESPDSLTVPRELTSEGADFRFAVYPAEAFGRSVYEPRAGENWFLGVIQSGVPDEGTRSFQIFFVIAFCVAAAAVLYAATRFARRITVPLEKFDRATRTIAKGNLDVDIDVRTGDEVEDLAVTFRAMAGELRANQEERIRSAKLAAIGELTAEISHEIQNRISGMSFWLQYLDSDMEPDDPKREYLNEMKEGLSAFLEMLANLKENYRTPVPLIEEVDMAGLLEDSLVYVSESAAERGVRISVTGDSGPLAVRADPEMIRSVIVNLVLNAVEASPEGSEVTVRTVSNGRNVVLSVEDKGEGITEEDLPKIFYPFFSTKAGGSGLGLAIAANLAAAHGGRIEADSRFGEGSTFTLVIPRSDGGQSPEK
ncbi:MAG TPA: ATP-binding protein [Aridibacter sp.]|nr:ATP-binding protein [Aridibacter sp.]